MLRITIETTAGEVTVTPSAGAEGGQGTAAAPQGEPSQTVPADLAARAAAVGASSAGPAPDSAPPGIGAPGFQPGALGGPAMPQADQPPGGTSAISAGAAPTASEADQGVEVEE
jgi:hypothetical protein